MLRELKGNPILAHQTHHARWPSVRTAVWIAAGLTVIELALTIAAFPLSQKINFLFYNSVFILLVEALLLVVSPLITGVVAVWATKKFITSEAYQIVRLSQLIEYRIVRGFVSGTIFRLRVVWMITGGLWLPLMVVLAYVSMTFETFLACVVIGPNTSPNCFPSQPLTIVILVASFLLIYTTSVAVLFIEWNRLAATLGVWVAFRIHHPVRALTGVLLLLVLFIALQVFLTFVVLAIPCVVLMFAGFDMWLVGEANREAVRACEAHDWMSSSESLLS